MKTKEKTFRSVAEVREHYAIPPRPLSLQFFLRAARANSQTSIAVDAAKAAKVASDRRTKRR
jgi:hypothetical protein